MSDAPGDEVAIILNDLTEFYSIRDAIDEILKSDICVDILVASNYSKKLASETERAIKNAGYRVASVSKKHYKILLEPYPSKEGDILKFDYRIKFRYAPISTKINPVYSPSWNLPYDAFIVHSKRDADAFSVYGEVYLIPYFKFSNFKKLKHHGKPNLLFLPTFGGVSSIEDIDNSTINTLKRKYNVIVKAHHAVQYKDGESDNYEKIKNIADDFYESDTPLLALLAEADVVLSDNSSAIFDAIYAEIPVAIFSSKHKLNQKKLGSINTPQFELAETGVIPCAEVGEQIDDTLTRAITLLPDQKKLKEGMFVFESDESPIRFVSVIKIYLSRNKDQDTIYRSRELLRYSWQDGRNAATKIADLRQELTRLQNKIESYENSKSWRITKPLRVVNKSRRKNEIE